MEYKNFPQIKTWSKQAQIGAIHIVRTHQGGGGVAKSYTPYKKYHFSYTKCVLGEGGGGGENLRFCAYVLCEWPHRITQVVAWKS